MARGNVEKVFEVWVVIFAVKVSNVSKIYERKKGVKTYLKERIEIFLPIHDNGVRHAMKCLQVTSCRTNVRESSSL